VTEDEFIRELERLLARYPEFSLARLDPEGGDIVLRRKSSRTSARARNIAAAFQAIMMADAKKPRGGGWI
jgi:hypothetical protein